jgi:spermidine/putrescine transport system ATP-binding protein
VAVSEWIVEAERVNKSFGDNHVVKNMSLRVKEGEFLTLLGPSGCGKTTMLRMISGFEAPTSGRILVQGEPVENKEPYEREVNTVFQSYALFPHMTVFDNIAYGLKMKKVPKAERRARVQEMLDLVQLSEFGKRHPAQLSGGQKQRVAIARALVNQPKVLLLDEPLGALDLKLRKQMQLELKRLQKKLNITFIYVTHDQEEALTMSDRIGVINGGVLEQVGTAEEIYEHPASEFVARFIGETNLLSGYVWQAAETENAHVVAFETGKAPANGTDFAMSHIVSVSIRPERLQFSTAPVEGFSLCAEVKEHIYIGSTIYCVLTLPNGDEMKLQRRSGEAIPETGQMVYLFWALGDEVMLHSKSDMFYWALKNAEVLQPLERGAIP